MIGYLGLGGRVPQRLLPSSLGTEVRKSPPQSRQPWGIVTHREVHELSLPSRSKQVTVLADFPNLKAVELLDSAEGATYRDKLATLNFSGFIINSDEKGRTHGIAIVNCDLSFVGLFDQFNDYAYLVWLDDSRALQALLDSNPLRYLIYRFQPIYKPVFLPIQAVASKWMRTHNNPLLAFNALERRIGG